MIVHLDFASTFANLLGQNSVDLEIEAHEVTVDDVLTSLLAQYSHWAALLEKHHYCQDGQLKVMCVVDQELVTGSSVITDGARMRILIPICGG